MAEPTGKKTADRVIESLSSDARQRLAADKVRQVQMQQSAEALRGRVAQQEAEYNAYTGQNQEEKRLMQIALREQRNLLTKTEADLGSLDSTIAGGVSSYLSGQDRDIAKGATVGADILGEEGLGRLGTDPAVQEALSRYKDLSQGMSAQELQASKERAFEGINQGTQTQSRALASMLASQGVRGGVAGAQLRDVQIAGLSKKADVERDLFLADREARIQGLDKYATTLGETRIFDLGQEASEKNIVLQSALGFAQLGQAERSAQVQAKAAAEAAQAKAAAACFLPGSLILMADGTTKAIEEIKIGDKVMDGSLGGGTVYAVLSSLVECPAYILADTLAVTGTHAIYDELSQKWVRAKEYADKSAMVTPIAPYVVHNIGVSSHKMVTASGIKVADQFETDFYEFITDEESLERMNGATRCSVSI